MLFVPADLPVLRLASSAAVKGDTASGAGVVHLNTGDGPLWGTAVGAVADGRRRGTSLFTFPFAFPPFTEGAGGGAGGRRGGGGFITASSSSAMGSHLSFVLLK